MIHYLARGPERNLNKSNPQRVTLQWRHNGRSGVSNHHPRNCLLNRYSGTDQIKHQTSASFAFVREIHRWPVNSPHKLPVTREMFPFGDAIMIWYVLIFISQSFIADVFTPASQDHQELWTTGISSIHLSPLRIAGMLFLFHPSLSYSIGVRSIQHCRNLSDINVIKMISKICFQKQKITQWKDWLIQ